MSTFSKSKHLSWLLRHGAVESRLRMDAAGWADVADVLAMTRMSEEELAVVIAENNKSRLQREGPRIRACQGHSYAGTPVTAEALEASWAPWVSASPLWHGTTVEAVPSIAREGIIAQARTHVHLAEAIDSKVGKRAAVAVMLEVSPAKVRAAGLGIFVSPNGVVLVRHVPASAIVGVRTMTARAHPQRDELVVALGL